MNEQEKFIKNLIFENIQANYEWSTGDKDDQEIEKEYQKLAQEVEKLFDFKMPKDHESLRKEIYSK